MAALTSMDERKGPHRRHSVTMEQRERVTIAGIIDILSFDEESVVADTEMGILVVRGINLHVNKLNLESGELNVDGEIDTLMYEDEGFAKEKKTSFFKRIFR